MAGRSILLLPARSVGRSRATTARRQGLTPYGDWSCGVGCPVDIAIQVAALHLARQDYLGRIDSKRPCFSSHNTLKT